MSTHAVRATREKLADYWASVAGDLTAAHALHQQAHEIEARLTTAAAPLQAELAAAEERAARTLGPWVHSAVGLYASRYVYGRERGWQTSIAWLRRVYRDGQHHAQVQVKPVEHALTSASTADLLREADDILVREGWFLIEREDPALAVDAAHALRLEAAVNRRMGRQHGYYDFHDVCPVCGASAPPCPCEVDERLVVSADQVQHSFTQAITKNTRPR